MTERAQASVGGIAIVALFVTALVTAQLTAAKVLTFSLPISLPVTGSSLVLPGAAFAYALTFFASDCYAELYGRRAAQVVVNVGFAMNFVVLALVWATIFAPGANPEFAAQFRTVIGSGTNVILGSLLAYVVSQNWDVLVFHRLREATRGDYLWLRNIGSTATSQVLDTVLFVSVAFYVAPTVLGIGEALPTAVLVSLAVGQYLLKFVIALLDTPFVYLTVATFRNERLGSLATAD
ncbi:MAG: queuosine precursor transporter [Halobacteriota archaeon]